MLSSLERLLLALWAAALWGIGYIAAPVLFSAQPDRQLAGMLAGEMFHWVSFIGLVCGAVLVLLNRRQPRRLMLLAVMLVLVALSEFALTPQMAALKASGLLPGSEEASRFGLLHGVSSSLYLITSLAVAWLVWRGPVKAAD